MARGKPSQLWQTESTARAVPETTQRHALRRNRNLGLPLFFLLGRFLGRPLERGTENITERRAGVGGAVLGDRLFLLGDFERLDRDLHLVGATVELDHATIDLLPDCKAF